MLEAARGIGATHIAIIDADEIITGNLLPKMRGWCDAMAPGWMMSLPQINLRGCINTMHGSGVWAEQHTAMVFRDEPSLHWAAAHDGYQHHSRAPHGIHPARQFRPITRAGGGVMHLQMVDEKRLRAKQLAYCLHDMLRYPERRTPEQTRQYYSLAVYGCVPAWTPSKEDSWRLSREMPGLKPAPDEWWEPYRDLLPHLHADAEAWQLEECRRLVRENPQIMVGLDPYGLDL